MQDFFWKSLRIGRFTIFIWETTGFSNRYNPLALQTQSVSWTDLNGDGVPQGELGCTYQTPGCEINVAGQLPKTFGVASLPTFDVLIWLSGEYFVFARSRV